jgi:CRP-like cAMP-binding protein
MLESAPPRGLGERLLALRSFSLLALLPPSELALVARLSRERDFRAGQQLAVEGEPVQAVQLLISGRATLSRAGVPLQTAGAFDTVGLLPIAAAVPHPFAAVALEPIQALEMEAGLAAEVLEDDFALFARVLRLGATSALARLEDRPAMLGGSPPPDGSAAGTSFTSLDAAGRLLVLRKTRLFGKLPVDGLAAFAKRLELVSLSAGEHLRTARSSKELVVIASGQADVTWGAHAGTAIDAGAGTVLGALEALADQPAPLAVRARTPVQLLRAGVDDLLDVLEDHHSTGRRLMAELLGFVTGV